MTGVGGDPPQRLADRPTDDGDADGLVTGEAEVALERGAGVDEGGAATGDDALLDRGAGRRDGVLDAVLALLDLDLGVAADLDDHDAAGELGEALLQLLAVPVGVGPLDLGLDLRDPAGDGVRLGAAVDDGRVVLGDDDPAGGPEDLETDLLEVEPDVGGDDLRTGQHGHVLQHRLAAVAEARGLDRDGGEGAADLVHDERGQRLALDVVGDDEEGLGGLQDLLHQRQQLLDGGDLAPDEQHVGVGEDGLHALGVGDHVRAQVALVELHALGELQADPGGGALLDGDDAVAADLVERLGQGLTDGGVLRGDGGDVGDRRGVGDLDRDVVQAGLEGGDGRVHPSLQATGRGARGHVAQALVDHGLGEDGRGGGAVAGDVVGLGRGLLRQLGAEVLEAVLELDLAGDGDTVVGDDGRAEGLGQDDVAPLRPEGDLDRVGQGVDTALERLPGGLVVGQALAHVTPEAGAGVAGGHGWVVPCVVVRVRTDRCRRRRRTPPAAGGRGGVVSAGASRPRRSPQLTSR